jgi:hypothetical protein
LNKSTIKNKCPLPRIDDLFDQIRGSKIDLRHVISEQGITVDHEKIESIRGWPTPNNVLEFRSFMGLVGYYKRFIAGFSKINAHPITSLQKKGIKFEWTTKCEENFNSLK